MKRQRQGGNTGESRLLNVGYLQDQDADQAKRQTGKEEIQEKKNDAKKEREFQAECRNLRENDGTICGMPFSSTSVT